MCGRFTMRTPGSVMIDQFSLDFQGELTPRYNIAPTQAVPIIRTASRSVSQLRWGLVPFWSKDPKGGARMINARSETAATKPAFRHCMKKKRCLVPADGYFEWIKEGKQKLPYWIRLRDERPFLMAGLWDTWRDKSAPEHDEASSDDERSDEVEPLRTFTILTTSSNSLTQDIHDRMPVILSPNDYDRWLDPEITDGEALSYMFEPYDSNEMQLTRVTTRVNSVKNDDEQCIQPEKTLF